MEILTLHIEYLLLRHDCVIVPGIGAFINIYHAPVFDFKTGHITPPYTEIVFNPALKSDDGLLYNSFSRKFKVSYREGAEIMEKEISNLTDTLLTDGEVTLGRLGIIRRREEGNIVFIPFREAQLVAADLGLIPCKIFESSAKSEKESQAELNTKNYENNDSGTTALRNNSSTETVPEITLSEMEKFRKMNFKRNYYIPFNKILAKASACLIIALVFTAIWFSPTNRYEGKEERASVFPIDKIIDTALHSKSESEKIETNKQDTVSYNNSTHKGEKSLILPYEEITPDYYYLIVGTSKTLKEAEDFVELNKNRGYDLKIIHSKKINRVAALSSPDRSQLIDSMNSQSFKNIYPSSWIWKK